MFSLLYIFEDSVRHTSGRPAALSAVEQLQCPMCNNNEDKWVKRWNPRVHSALANWCHDSLSKDDCMEFQKEVADVGAH